MSEESADGPDPARRDADDPARTDDDGSGETVTYGEPEGELAADPEDRRERALPVVDERASGEGPNSAGETGLDPVPEDGAAESDGDLVVDPDEDADNRRAEPLGDLADAVGRRREASPTDEDPFEREDVSGIDGDAVWERIERDDYPYADLEGLEDREIREISTRSYCNQCEHFAAPPDIGCTNDGTEILELSSMETFRVADCPVVLEEEKLEAGTGERNHS